MKFAGIALIIVALIDFIGSYMGFDLWGEFIGVDLPEAIWKISAYLEFGAGYLLMKMGSASEETPVTEAE